MGGGVGVSLGFGIEKRSRGIRFGEAPRVDFGRFWAATRSPLGLLASPVGDILIPFGRQVDETNDAASDATRIIKHYETSIENLRF